MPRSFGPTCLRRQALLREPVLPARHSECHSVGELTDLARWLWTRALAYPRPSNELC